ncbi:hypothetical protein MKW98_009550 [Papaver atlanticum]|uniref:Uncharacterized protein n=1 Tax=Papaver atlanticum TaxID=357466 RepID=A0AAD4SGB1_9MAGN|nr:hypothetical protein MKW98_009550 [Papaver atlanticum]
MPLTIQGQLSSPSDSTVSQYPFRMSGVIAKSENFTTRRSANYKASDWGHDFVQSLKSDYAEENYTRRSENLKEKVKLMFADQVCRGSLSSTLKLINVIQRLGVSYHFDGEIRASLDTINKKNYGWEKDDLFTRALRFRLLRQHRYEVSQDVFKQFMAEMTNTSSAGVLAEASFNDIEGVVSVYEASFYAFEGEDILDEARKLVTEILQEYLLSSAKDQGNTNSITERLVRHALELPFHWIARRVEARWYIDTYEMMQDMNPLLLEFAKLDFNILQAKYQEELKHISRWWKELGCIELLSFSRNRFVEMFVWSIWCHFEPEFDISRVEITKWGALATLVDDAYDVYGTLEELKMFTDAVERWDVNKIADLPDYMKVLYLAVYNTTNAIAYEVLKKRGLDILSDLKKVWADFCKAYFLEAKWYYSGYTPTFEEYMDNGWVSASGYSMPLYAYLLQGNEITKEALECIENHSSDFVRYSLMIIRLLDDLQTSSHEQERGDTPKAIQCYMHQNGVSETIAREHIKHMIHDLWKKMNGDEYSRSIFPRQFIDFVENYARSCHCIYQFEDWYGGKAGPGMKNRIVLLIEKPIPIKKNSLT